MSDGFCLQSLDPGETVTPVDTDAVAQGVYDAARRVRQPQSLRDLAQARARGLHRPETAEQEVLV